MKTDFFIIIYFRSCKLSNIAVLVKRCRRRGCCLCRLLHFRRPLNPFETGSHSSVTYGCCQVGLQHLPQLCTEVPNPAPDRMVCYSMASLLGLITTVLTPPQNPSLYSRRKCAVLQGYTSSFGTSQMALHFAYPKSMIQIFVKYSTSSHSLQQVPSGSSGKCRESASLLNNDFGSESNICRSAY